MASTRPEAEGLITEQQTVAKAQTCLPQDSIFPLWKDGFQTWHIAFFLVGLIFGNLGLLLGGIIAHPSPGEKNIEFVLNPKENQVFLIFLLTSAALFAKTHFMAWIQVWSGCKNNSFSKNPWDWKTGSPNAEAKKTEDDLAKKTYHNIHENDIENIPLTLFLHLLLVLIQTTVPVAKFIMITYTVSRYIHTFWYAWYGSHEIRATLWSLNCFCNYAAVYQIVAAAGYL
jgi:hypothetical protein